MDILNEDVNADQALAREGVEMRKNGDRPNLNWVSLTGAEDSVDPRRLAEISKRHPQAEWALLALHEREGEGRNPSQAWREKFLDALEGRARTALHLCGKLAFEKVLSEGVWPELARYGRVQANLNARADDFSRAQAMEVWRVLSTLSGGLIIQLHESVEPWARDFLAAPPPGARVEVLFDESKGRGVAPGAWREALPGLACGYAGGLGPENVARSMPAIAAAASEPGCWIDMETGLRTDGLFDLDKCARVLRAAEPWLASAPILAREARPKA